MLARCARRASCLLSGTGAAAAGCVALSSVALAEQAPAPPRTKDILSEGRCFQVYHADSGKPAKLRDVVAAMAGADVVLLGEYHDDPVAHGLELELLRRAHQQYGCGAARQAEPAAASPRPSPPSAPPAAASTASAPQAGGRRVVLSLEQFERDTQEVVDAYMAGLIRAQDFERDARAWPNYATDYRPLLELARREGLAVVAANAPRRYVSLAGRQGRLALQQLPAAAAAWLPPLPYAQPSEAYVRKVNDSMRGAAREMERLRREGAAAAGSRGVPGASSPHASAPGPGEQPTPAGASGVPAHPRDSPASAAPSAGGVPGPAGASAAPASPSAPDAGGVGAGAAGASPRGAAAGGGTAADAGGGDGCPYIGFSASSNFLDAQVLWDAAMASSIAGALARHQLPGGCPPLVLHVCGKFHAEQGLGIGEHLGVYAPRARVMVVTFHPAGEVGLAADELRAAGLVPGRRGDFVCLTDGKRPRSFAAQHPV